MISNPKEVVIEATSCRLISMSLLVSKLFEKLLLNIFNLIMEIKTIIVRFPIWIPKEIPT